MEELNLSNLNKLCLSIKETSDITGIGPTKLYEVLDSGALPAKKWGKRTLILKSDLEVFLSNLDAYKAETVVQNG